MNTKYLVALSAEQRQHLENLTSFGKAPARQTKRAQILLKSDLQVNWSYERIMAAFDVSGVTISAVQRAFVEQGLEAALLRKNRIRNMSMFWMVKAKLISLPWLAANRQLGESIGVSVCCRIGL